jgi:signal transduction histidine kinase
LRDSAGKPVRIVGSTIDVNAQKLAQAHKEQLEAQLRQSQKMEAIGTLAGGIAHDFNNILGAILGYGELAHQHSAEGSPLRRYLDNVMHAAERAQMLIERILGFSRSGLGDRAPVNVQFVIEETLELLEPSLPAGIRLESRIESGNSAVIGDATYLHQVAMNLCTNAVQAMERGGTLRVILECVDVKESRTLSRGLLHAGSLCAADRQRYGRRHSACGARTDVRPLLHHQRCRPGYRPWVILGARHRQRSWGRN